MKKIVVVDIDGTIANIEHRLHYIKGDYKDWNKFFTECYDDEPIKGMIDLVTNLSKEYRIVFCTGRSAVVAFQTRNWLERFFPHNMKCVLLMRRIGDKRKDVEAKTEMLRHYLDLNNGHNDVAFILEDRTQMVKEWRRLGHTCLQVSDGDF
jgi:uncharacterized HAD superfamily protein